MTSAPLCEVLDECASNLLERHLAHAKEWFPHELVPWELGRKIRAWEDAGGRRTASPRRCGVRPIREPAHGGQPPALFSRHRGGNWPGTRRWGSGAEGGPLRSSVTA